MRLSEWQARTSHRDSMADKVLGPARDALALLGAELDPECWIVWGDDPGVRWTILVPSVAGLIQINVRVNIPGEGPRSAGKLIRWHRVQIGELSVEIQGGHRLLTFQVESHLLHGADAEAEAVGAFVETLFAAMDGRPPAPTLPDVIELSGPRTSQP
ncbi:MAG: hypothetical protein Q7S35_10290 [Candidatus Limnocylindrales bacterium]|nr:hypothetical protein [Candidatus Limnocylindrales bacterium]